MSGLHIVKKKRAALTVGLLLASIAFTRTAQSKDHEAELAEAAKAPIIERVLETPDGGSLTDAQNAEIQKSDKLMADARDACNNGDFAAAAERSQQALDIRVKILGPKHFLTVTAGVLNQTLSQWRQLPSDTQQKIADAVKQRSSAQTIHDGGDFRAAAETAEKAVALLKSVLPADHVELAAALLMQGKAQVDIGQYDAADEALSDALRITERVYGKDHPQTALVLDRIGWLRFYQSRQGTPDRAMALAAVDALTRAVKILRSTVGENREFAEALDNLGTVQAPFGKDEAEVAKANKLRALAVRRKVLGPDDKDTGVSYSNLAWIYEQLEEDDKVIPLRKKALAIFEKSLGETHPYCHMEKGNLARVYQLRNRTDEAIKLYEESVALDKKSGEKPTRESVGRLAQLGGAYLEAGRIDQGIQTFSRVNEQAESLFNAGQQTSAVNILHNSSMSCEQHRLFEPALKFREKVFEWDNQLRGKNDDLPHALRAASLGSLYTKVGRLEDARKSLMESTARVRKLIREKQADDFRLIIPLSNLTDVLEKLGDLDKAEEICQEVVKLCESQLGPKNPITARAMARQGRINTAQDRLVMAQFFLEDAQRIFEESESKDPFVVIEILQHRARLHSAKKNPDEAVTLLLKALERCEDWPEEVQAVHQYSIKAETLKLLLDATDAHDSAKTDRQSWKSQLETLLKKLESLHALDAEQKEWMKQLKT